MLENNIYIMLGNRCNLNCDFCFIKALHRKDKYVEAYMDNDNIKNWTNNTIREIIQDNTNNNIISNIIFFGGEPLLYLPTIYEIVDYLKNNLSDDLYKDKYRFSITTNLTVDSAVSKIEKLFNYIGKLEISTSFDSVGRFDVYNYTRFLENATALTDLGYSFKIITIIKEDMNTDKLREVINITKPSCIQYEKYTVNNKVIDVSNSLKYTLLHMAKEFKDILNIDLVCSCQEEPAIGCFRDGNCSSITLDLNNQKIFASCPKVFGSDIEKFVVTDEYIPHKFKELRSYNKEENLKKQYTICKLCNRYKLCSSYCRVSGCMNLEKDLELHRK